jgi:hypothetical protein
MFNKIRIKMWKKNCSRNVLNNKNKPDIMSQNKLRKEKKLILPWIKWIKKNRNIVTSIFLKLDYIYLIKLIKQIKYIIPLQKHKINYNIKKIKILNTCIIKEQL